MDRRPNTQSLQWFVDRNASGELDLDPPFQRRSVWSLDYQRYFVDTVLRGYPSPPIFLEVVIEPGEPSRYNVVDGKQRLSALFAFLNSEFNLEKHRSEEGDEDAYWTDLSTEVQRTALKYAFTVEEIADTSESELRDAFGRLNRNVARLTPQELRHAQFPGVFLERMESLAGARFWSDRGIFGAADIRRMRDIEFVSELFLLTMHGVEDGKREIIDQYYADYEDEIVDEAENREAFDQIMDSLRELKDLDWSRTRWTNLSDLYALWGAIDQLLFNEDAGLLDPAETARLLTEFSEQQAEIVVAARNREPLPGSSSDRRYFDAVRQGANKESNRTERIRIIADLLRA